MTDREQEQLLATATDRFEPRLAEEGGALRVTMVERDAALRQDITDLRVEMSGQNAALRREITEGDAATRLEIAKLRLDVSEQFAESRVHSEEHHRELLKWALMFWIAQAAATAGIVSALA